MLYFGKNQKSFVTCEYCCFFNLGIIDYPIAVKQFHSDYVKCVVWLLAHFLRKKRQRETIDIPVIPSGPFERKTAVIITQPSSMGPEAIKKEPVDVRAKSELSFESLEDVLSSQENGVKLNSLKPSRRSARPAPSPSLGSLASILTNNEETAFVSSKAAKERKSRSSAKSTNLPGTVPDSDDDLWDLDSELSDSGFGLSSADARKKTTNDVGGNIFVIVTKVPSSMCDSFRIRLLRIILIENEFY